MRHRGWVGAQFGVVTRSGGNHSHGAATTDFQFRALNATNVAGGTPADRAITRPAVSLGGPLVRDRLWYFGTYRYIRERTGVARTDDDLAVLRMFQPGFVPFDSQLQSHQSIVKATYQPTTAGQLALSVQFDRTVTANGAFQRWTQERAQGARGGGPIFSAAWRRLIGARASIDAQAGYYSKPFHASPQGDGPSLRVYSSVVSSGGRQFGSGPLLVEMGNVPALPQQRQRHPEVFSG